MMEYYQEKSKRNQKRNQNGYGSQGVSENTLTDTERVILSYFLVDPLSTPRQIAIKHGCSDAYVRKVRLKLRNFGILSKVTQNVTKYGGDSVTAVTKQDSMKRRIHAQKFRIALIKPIDNRYTPNVFFKLDGHDVQTFSDVVCVQAKRGFSFEADTEDEAVFLSMDYWNVFLQKLENALNTPLLKEGKQNITCTYTEWATTPSELAKTCAEKKQEIRIYSKDGKLRFTCDKSHLWEHEAHHHLTGKEDSETGNRFIEDVLDHPELPIYSDTAENIRNLSKLMLLQAKALPEDKKMIQTQLNALFDGLSALNSTLNKVLSVQKQEEPKSPESERIQGDKPFYVG